MSLRTLVSSFLLMSVLSCADDGPPYPTVDRFCEGRATEECQQANKCPVNRDACIAKRKNDCLVASATVDTGRTYAPEYGERCVQKTHEVYAATTIVPSALRELRDVCQRAFQGNVERLGSCTDTYACKGELICDKGRCAPLVTRKSGELCGNPGEICDATSFCVANGSVFECAGRRQLSQACGDIPCVTTLRCDTVCKEKLKAADSCRSDDECPTDAPYCDPAVGNKCDAGLIFAPGAAACADFGG